MEQLPGQLNYELTENGEGLSSGQKQRLSLARAILKNPKLLILDEASANLDIDTELDIAKMLRELNKQCTIIIVSHREGLLTYCNRIIDLNKKMIEVIR